MNDDMKHYIEKICKASHLELLEEKAAVISSYERQEITPEQYGFLIGMIAAALNPMSSQEATKSDR